jgi:hypothetical protein
MLILQLVTFMYPIFLISSVSFLEISTENYKVSTQQGIPPRSVQRWDIVFDPVT